MTDADKKFLEKNRHITIFLLEYVRDKNAFPDIESINKVADMLVKMGYVAQSTGPGTSDN